MGEFFRSFWWLILAFLFGIIGLGFYTQQQEFWKILLFYSPMFLAYGCLLKYSTFQKLNTFLVLGIACRFILLFAFPFLSDDLYRFIWDGRLWQQGINPFNYLPTYFMLEGNQVEGLDQALFEQLNSPEYFTIYPPLNLSLIHI